MLVFCARALWVHVLHSDPYTTRGCCGLVVIVLGLDLDNAFVDETVDLQLRCRREGAGYYPT